MLPNIMLLYIGRGECARQHQEIQIEGNVIKEMEETEEILTYLRCLADNIRQDE